MMKENDMTPIVGYNDTLLYDEFKKEELDEAGVVMDYIDDELIDTAMKKHDKQRRWLSWFMFLFLIFSFLVVVLVGSLRIWYVSSEMNKVQDFFETSEAFKEGV